jgi:hypothetical protein
MTWDGFGCVKQTDFHKILLITLRHINVLHEDITYIQCYMAK